MINKNYISSSPLQRHSSYFNLYKYSYYSTRMSEDKVYTWKEVGQHNSEEDLWVVIGDYVYDVTKYTTQHPGGPIVLAGRAGRNASLAFEQASHSVNAKENIMPKWRIGKIDPESEKEDWQKQVQSASPNILVTVGLFVLILVTIYFLAA